MIYNRFIGYITWFDFTELKEHIQIVGLINRRNERYADDQCPPGISTFIGMTANINQLVITLHNNLQDISMNRLSINEVAKVDEYFIYNAFNFFFIVLITKSYIIQSLIHKLF